MMKDLLKWMRASVKPDPKDPLKVRRFIALFSVLYALFVWPHLLIFYHLVFGLPEGVVGEMLVYIGTLAAGPAGAYLFAAHKKQMGQGLTGEDEDA